MKYSAFLAVASAAVASSQLIFNESTGTFTCPASSPNGAFCAGDSLSTNIIIRCTNGVGQPGNCNDNLAGVEPLGVRFSPCYETAPTAGDAACSKNGIVYGPYGNYPLPGYGSSSSSSSSSTGYISSSSVSSTVSPTTTPYYTPTSVPSYPTAPSHPNTTVTDIITVTVTSTCITEGSTSTTTYTTVIVPPTTTLSTKTITYSTGTGTGVPYHPGNGTVTVKPSGHGSATATPVGPTTTSPTEFTGAASSNSAGAFIAALGFAAAYFL